MTNLSNIENDQEKSLALTLEKDILGSFAIQIPKSVNHIYGVSKNRQIYLKTVAKDIVTDISNRTLAILPTGWESIAQEWVENHWVIVDVDTYDNFKFDLSNRHYLISNGIERGLGIDDRNFLFRDNHRLYTETNQRVVLTIRREPIGTDNIKRRRK